MLHQQTDGPCIRDLGAAADIGLVVPEDVLDDDVRVLRIVPHVPDLRLGGIQAAEPETLVRRTLRIWQGCNRIERFGHEQRVRVDQQCSFVRVFCLDPEIRGYGMADVCIGGSGDRRVRIEPEVRVLDDKLDAIKEPADAKHLGPVHAEVSAEASGYRNTVFGIGEVKVGPVELVRAEQHSEVAGLAIAIQGEQAVNAIAVLEYVFDRFRLRTVFAFPGA